MGVNTGGKSRKNDSLNDLFDGLSGKFEGKTSGFRKKGKKNVYIRPYPLCFNLNARDLYHCSVKLHERSVGCLKSVREFAFSFCVH